MLLSLVELNECAHNQTQPQGGANAQHSPLPVLSPACVNTLHFHYRCTHSQPINWAGSCVCACGCVCGCVCVSATPELGDEAQSYGPILINGSPGNSVECVSQSSGRGEGRGTVAKRGCSMKTTSKPVCQPVTPRRGRVILQPHQRDINASLNV